MKYYSKTIVVIALIGAFAAQSATVYAAPEEINVKLGIPAQPRSMGDEYGDGGQVAGLKLGLGSCGDLGIDTSVQNLIGLASQVINNAKGLASAAAMATMSYMMPTEFSVVANLSSQAQKILQILADRCKVYQEARKHLEKEDIAGVRSAAFARCMEKRAKLEGDAAQISCSNPETAWQDLWGTSGCISAIDKATENVSTFPDGMDRGTLKAWLGDFKICPNNSNNAVPPRLTTTALNNAVAGAYQNNVMSALGELQRRTLTDADIRAKQLCVGGAAALPGGKAGAVICPTAEGLNMLRGLPAAEQQLYARRLADNLALLETVYRSYAMSAFVQKAGASNPNMAGLKPEMIAQLADKKEKETNAFVKTLQLARGGADGDLQKWEQQVLERRNYWLAHEQNVTRAEAQRQTVTGATPAETGVNVQQRIDRVKAAIGGK